MSHPTREDWVAYLYGEADARDRASFTSHLRDCGECRQQVERWRATMHAMNAWEMAPVGKPRRASLPRWGPGRSRAHRLRGWAWRRAAYRAGARRRSGTQRGDGPEPAAGDRHGVAQRARRDERAYVFGPIHPTAERCRRVHCPCRRAHTAGGGSRVRGVRSSLRGGPDAWATDRCRTPPIRRRPAGA